MQENNIQIQKISIENLNDLQTISRQTFQETFANQNDEANMHKYLEEKFSTEQLGSELSNPESEFYLAIQKEQIIGYLKLNSGAAQTENIDSQALEIERIYVLQAFHGGSVGKFLFEKALQRATEKKVSYIWLGVWEENPRAIRFYEKNGFVTFDKHIFKLGDDEQTDLMMKLVIKQP